MDFIPFKTFPSFDLDNLDEALPSLEFEFVYRNRRKVQFRENKPFIDYIRRDKTNTLRNQYGGKVASHRPRYLNLLVLSGTPHVGIHSFDLYQQGVLIERNIKFFLERYSLIRLCLTKLDPSQYHRHEDTEFELYCYEENHLLSCSMFTVSWWKAPKTMV